MNTPQPRTIFASADMQDKATPRRVSFAPSEADWRSPLPQSPKHHGSQKRRGQKVLTYLYSPEVAELERLTKEAGINPVTKKAYTRIAVASGIWRLGLAVKLGKQQVDVILPPILEAVRQELQAFANRFMHVLEENYDVTKQGEEEIQHVLSVIYKSNPERFHEVVKKAREGKLTSYVL